MDLHPIEIVGRHPGPKILILAGIHGDEYEPIAAVRRLAGQIDREQLTGKVTLVPIANHSAYLRHSRVGTDQLDLARTFPGSADGTPTQQVAHAITGLIQQSDLMIDLHTGGLAMEISPLVGYMLVSDPSTLQKQRQMATAFGLPIVWGTTASLPGRSLSAARDANVPAIYAEWGGGGGCQAAGVAAYTAGCLQVMAQCEMLPSPAAAAPVDRCVIEDDRDTSGHLQLNYPAPHAGFYEPTLPLDSTVRPGDELGRLHDPFTSHTTTIYSTQTGRLFTRRVLPPVEAGDCLAVILEDPAETGTTNE
ncbi:Succinylglutamate desuccinylase [Rosistilla carotiformis]|uniref:Succinylglutamate desuccinylase n=1 Tax=Rosistilla carotiformis TaxID=2528017 RepID=A0A518JUK9_9BACT|nr:M14 family metallopeptidase [Rosistilla carotiformis]QDV69227.1 Succinylglutamate desuccinylase [Rosistilla carotiformis]